MLDNLACATRNFMWKNEKIVKRLASNRIPQGLAVTISLKN